MLPQYLSDRNLRFVLLEMLKTQQLTRFERYTDYDKDAIEPLLDAAMQIADQHLFPFYMEMDRKKAVCVNGVVTTHPQLKVIIQSIAEGGWIGAHADPQYGGMNMPLTLLYSGLFTFYAANVNACYPFLTQGAANLILSFGSDALKEQFVHKMHAGEWQGTMALTEPQAGSSLTDITSTAEPTETAGTYRIKGQKIFISGGDHSAAENFVHLLLARIKGAPAGTKGISLFVVPKYRSENNQFVSNDVITAGIFGKMGQKGYTAAHLMYGEKEDCYGYLVGEPHKGLNYMFQMMNEARIGTGLVAAGAASAAYYASLKYANERPQGRLPSNKDVSKPQIPIIEHADVRRMLLFQKSVVEGSIALLMQCSYYADLERVAAGDEKHHAFLLLELLTPIAKSFPSEYGVLSVSQAMQVLGGAGYCDDFPVEQIYRDIRVNAIYEGTTGIHGLDLLGRKVFLEKGKAVQLFGNELINTISLSENASKYVQKAGRQLGAVAQKLQDVTQQLMKMGQEHGAETLLADATLFLEYFSLVAIAWIWLKQAVVADEALQHGAAGDEKNFYESKIHTMRYFYEYELPKTKALHQRLSSTDKLTLTAPKEYFI
jgi:alkylation response protein AidB-like acyl-CoA dehydrogenase